MVNLAACADPLGNIHAITGSHGCVVIECDLACQRLITFTKVNKPLRFHANRNESTALARQWEPISEVLDHAVMMLCHPDKWGTIMKLFTWICYSTGEPAVFYDDMAMAMCGPNVVELEPVLLPQRCNLTSL